MLKKVHRAGSVEPDPLHGLFEVTLDGLARVVEYEPDSDLRDSEQVPLLEDGGIEAFIRREVLPYAPDAWFVASRIKIGLRDQLHPLLLQAPAAAPPRRDSRGDPRARAGDRGIAQRDRRGGERMITELRPYPGHEALGGGVARGRA